MAVRDPLRSAVQGDQLTVSAEVASGDPAAHRVRGRADVSTQIIGYQFAGPSFLTEALTHPSALVPERGRGRRAETSSARL